jgi:hypothetical protein
VNTAEQWAQWRPIDNLSAKYYVDSISDTLEGFTIQLSTENKHDGAVLVVFEISVDAYRSTDESYRLSTISDLSKRYGDSFYGTWTFFKVSNSEYLQWLSTQSFEITDTLDFIHFAFVTGDSILDVICIYEPKVKFVSTPQKD